MRCRPHRNNNNVINRPYMHHAANGSYLFFSVYLRSFSVFHIFTLCMRNKLLAPGNTIRVVHFRIFMLVCTSSYRYIHFNYLQINYQYVHGTDGTPFLLIFFNILTYVFIRFKIGLSEKAFLFFLLLMKSFPRFI